MENNNKKQDKNDFHAVDFMREVRSDLTEKFLNDKQNYLKYIRHAMEEFKLRQKKVYS